MQPLKAFTHKINTVYIYYHSIHIYTQNGPGEWRINLVLYSDPSFILIWKYTTYTQLSSK